MSGRGGVQGERERAPREEEMDEVDEASIESFPASDPPAHGAVSGIGPPAPEEDEESPAPEKPEQGDGR